MPEWVVARLVHQAKAYTIICYNSAKKASAKAFKTTPLIVTKAYESTPYFAELNRFISDWGVRL